MKTSFCVSECPGKDSKQPTCPTVDDGASAAQVEAVSKYCKNGKTEGVSKTYPTRTYVKYCIPRSGLHDKLKNVWNDMMSTLKSGGVGQYLFDVLNASTVIFICLGTAFLYALLFIGFLSAFAEPLCYLCIVVIQLGLITLPILFGYKFMQINKQIGDSKVEGATPLPKEELELLEGQSSIYLILAIGVAVLGVCFALCLWCSRESLKRAIDVIDASADFVMATKRILIVPFIYFLLTIIVVIMWFVGYVMVMSTNPINASHLVP